jgi:hypothetical protein
MHSLNIDWDGMGLGAEAEARILNLNVKRAEEGRLKGLAVTAALLRTRAKQTERADK